MLSKCHKQCWLLLCSWTLMASLHWAAFTASLLESWTLKRMITGWQHSRIKAQLKPKILTCSSKRPNHMHVVQNQSTATPWKWPSQILPQPPNTSSLSRPVKILDPTYELILAFRRRFLTIWKSEILMWDERGGISFGKKQTPNDTIHALWERRKAASALPAPTSEV